MLDCWMKIMAYTTLSACGLKTSSETAPAMSVMASMTWALNCLYSGCGFSSKQASNRSSDSAKCVLKLSLIATAVEAKAVTEFSFWMEIPYLIIGASLPEMAPMWGSTSSWAAPSMKLVMADAQCAETLGTGSSSVLTKAGKTSAP